MDQCFASWVIRKYFFFFIFKQAKYRNLIYSHPDLYKCLVFEWILLLSFRNSFTLWKPKYFDNIVAYIKAYIRKMFNSEKNVRFGCLLARLTISSLIHIFEIGFFKLKICPNLFKKIIIFASQTKLKHFISLMINVLIQ